VAANSRELGKGVPPLAASLVRPERQQGESLFGFFYRHFALNGSRIPAEVALVLRAAYQTAEWERRASAQGILDGLVFVRHPEGVDKWSKWRRHFGYLNNAYKGWPAAEGDLNLCPLCLQLEPVHLALWEVPRLPACPIHACKLVERCHSCRTPFTWARLNPAYMCDCGQDLKTICPPAATTNETRFAMLIAGSAEIEIPHDYPAWASLAADGLSLCERYLLLRLLVVLRHSSGRNKEYKRNLPLVSNWPVSAEKCGRRLMRQTAKPGITTPLYVASKAAWLSALVRNLGYGHGDSPMQLMAIVRRHCLVTLKNTALIVNPHTHPNGVPNLLDHFSAWWIATSSSWPKPRRFYWSSNSAGPIPLVVEVVCLLLLAVERGLTPDDLSGLGRIWRAREALYEPCAPTELPQRIAQALATESEALILAIAKCLEDATGIAICDQPPYG